MKTKLALSFVALLFAVAIGRYADATTAAGGTLTVDWSHLDVRRDGSASFTLVFTRADGKGVGFRDVTVDAACTAATDNFGVAIYTTSGPSDPLCTTLASIGTRMANLIASCAASSKCNL